MSAKRPLRLGLYGGTFDPVHLGHLILAQDALEQLKLDAVLFIPARQSPFKPGKTGANEKQRLAMLKLALKGREKFWLSRCELDRPAQSYAIDTAAEIHDAFPRAKLHWLIGADQLPELHRWHRVAELTKLVTFALLPRAGATHGRTLPRKLLRLPHPRQVDISATEIRLRVKSNLPIDLLVPAPVAAYMTRHRLYIA
jgi:nicotinate-nucleotide adenylyltransferase